jgi:hypothetical protein
MKEKILHISLSLLVAIVVIIGSTAWGEEDRKSSFGERFHAPPLYKEYPEAKKISLPGPDYRGMVLEEAIRKRRSVREYSSRPLELDQVSQILFAAQGLTGSLHGRPVRAAPSAGALYPVEGRASITTPSLIML